MDAAPLLKSLPYFRDLPAEELDAVSFAMTSRSYPAGHVFIREGAVGDALFLLLSGEVEVVRHVGGNVDTLNRLNAGEFFGLVSLIDESPRSSTCRAATPCEVATLPKTGFALLFNNSAPVAYAFQCTLAAQLAKDFRNLDRQIREAVAKAG